MRGNSGRTGARYSFVTLRTEDWSQTGFVGRDGKSYRVEGYVEDGKGGWRCPTEKCGALCCQAIPLIGPLSEAPCGFLNQQTLCCSLQERGGRSAKPVSCIVWPRTQADVDLVNARFAEGDRRCYLKVVPVDGEDGR